MVQCLYGSYTASWTCFIKWQQFYIFLLGVLVRLLWGLVRLHCPNVHGNGSRGGCHPARCPWLCIQLIRMQMDASWLPGINKESKYSCIVDTNVWGINHCKDIYISLALSLASCCPVWLLLALIKLPGLTRLVLCLSMVQCLYGAYTMSLAMAAGGWPPACCPWFCILGILGKLDAAGRFLVSRHQ